LFVNGNYNSWCVKMTRRKLKKITLYHGTGTCVLDSIRKTGLRPVASGNRNPTLTDNFGMASFFAITHHHQNPIVIEYALDTKTLKRYLHLDMGIGGNRPWKEHGLKRNLPGKYIVKIHDAKLK